MKVIFGKLFLFFSAVVAGALLNLAFAPYRLVVLALLLPVITFYLINKNKLSPFRIGFGFGLGFFGFGVYWVVYSLYEFGNMPLSMAIGIAAGFVVILALFPAFAYHFSFNKNRHNPLRYLFLFPAIWTLLEWLREWFCTGFPWHYIGYSQTSSPLAGYAPIFGVFGISLFTLMCSGALYQACVTYQKNLRRNMYTNLIFVLVILAGGALLSLIRWTKPLSTPISIAIAQGNIPQHLKWSEQHIAFSLSEYARLSKPLWDKNQVIIWPETAIPALLNEVKDYVQTLSEQAAKNNTQLITGIPIQKENEYFNAAIGIGKQTQVYLKRLLVPFGEYTPFEPYLTKWLTALDIPLSDLHAGGTDQPVFTIRNINATIAICYEIAYPHLMRITDPLTGLIVTLSNDAWFGRSNAQAQHFQIAEMRALENERPVIFANNTGISGMINEKGRTLISIPANQSGTASYLIQARSGLTPWQRFSMDGVFILIIAFLISVYGYEKKLQSSL